MFKRLEKLGIKKTDLVELQKYTNPSSLIKLAMTAVVVFIKNKSELLDWAIVKQEFNKPGFLNLVIDLNMDATPQKLIDFVKKNFLQN